MHAFARLWDASRINLEPQADSKGARNVINLRAFTRHAWGDVARPRDVIPATHAALADSDEVRIGKVQGIAADDLLRENRDGGQALKCKQLNSTSSTSAAILSG